MQINLINKMPSLLLKVDFRGLVFCAQMKDPSLSDSAFS